MIDGNTKLLAIVGDPVEHARSPEAVNALLSQSGRNVVLVPWHVPADSFDVAMQGLRQTLNIVGLVITYPFKERATAFADVLQPGAIRVGAINALRRDADGRWTGGMFDGIGLVKAVESLNCRVHGQSVRLLGAGGAGSSIAHALAEAGAASLTIFDLDGPKADRLAASVRMHHPACPTSSGTAGLAGETLLINATPVGMSDADGLPADMSALSAAVAVVDIVPRAGGTALLALARERGCKQAGGAAMVAGQAAALLEFFRLAPGDTS